MASETTVEIAPSKFDLDFEKYKTLTTQEIHLDSRPRIRNILQELKEDQQWSWPPQPPKDIEKARALKRRKWPFLYAKVTNDICSVLSLIIGPWELLIAFGYTIFPKTFIPAMRESSEFCVLFVLLFLFEGFYHTLSGIVGLGLRSMRPHAIGFVYVAWPITFVMPLLGIFFTFMAFYTTEKWRILNEMETHLKGYSYHWYSQSNWDHYHDYMRCCGIDGVEDWKFRAVALQMHGHIQRVPRSCCRDQDHQCGISETSAYEKGCLMTTVHGVHALFVSGILCMIVALFLAFMGHLSYKEAQDFTGDPTHSMIFDNTTIANLKSNARALRREELFTLLNYYSIKAGEDLGMTEEVQNAKEYLGIAVPKTGQDSVSETIINMDQEPVGSASLPRVLSAASSHHMPGASSSVHLVKSASRAASTASSISTGIMPKGSPHVVNIPSARQNDPVMSKYEMRL